MILFPLSNIIEWLDWTHSMTGTRYTHWNLEGRNAIWESMMWIGSKYYYKFQKGLGAPTFLQKPLKLVAHFPALTPLWFIQVVNSMKSRRHGRGYYKKQLFKAYALALCIAI